MKKTEKSLNKKNINYVAVLLVIYDIIAVNLAYFLALWFRFDCKYSMVESSGYLDNFLKFVPIYSAFCILVFWGSKLYQSLWQFASFNEFSRIFISSFFTIRSENCIIEPKM